MKFSQLIFVKFSNIQFHENPSSGSRVDTRERTDRQEDMIKLINTFRGLWEQVKKKITTLNLKSMILCFGFDFFNIIQSFVLPQNI